MKIRKIAALALSGITLLTGCTLNEEGVVLTNALGAKDVFKIEETVCTLPEVKVYLCNYQNIYGSAYDVNLWEHESGNASLEEYVKNTALSELTRVICMDELAKKEEITLAEEDVKKADQAAKAYYKSLSKDEVTYIGISESGISKLYQDYALAHKLYTHLTHGVNDEVSDDEARVMEVMQIYIKDSDKAQNAKAALDSDKDFLSVALSYNEAQSIEITISRGELPQEVEDTAFSLDDDEVTPLIETDNGCYFIKCVNKFNQELTDERKLAIVKQRQKEAFDDIYEEFVAGLDSTLNEEVWEGIQLDLSGSITTDCFFQIYNEYFGE